MGMRDGIACYGVGAGVVARVVFLGARGGVWRLGEVAWPAPRGNIGIWVGVLWALVVGGVRLVLGVRCKMMRDFDKLGKQGV